MFQYMKKSRVLKGSGWIAGGKKGLAKQTTQERRRRPREEKQEEQKAERPRNDGGGARDDSRHLRGAHYEW